MKSILIISMTLYLSTFHAQTVQIETSLLNQGISENRWSQEGMMERGRKWAKVKGDYPLMQYDSLDGQVILEELITFPGITKAQAFKRMKEWAASHFSSVDNVIEYEDLETGKIFFKGYIEITHLVQIKFLWETETYPTTSDLYFTLLMTVKDEKAKIRFENLRFRNFRAGYSAGSYYVPGEWVETTLKTYLPVAWKSPSTWEATFDLLRKSMDSLRKFSPSVEHHIRSIVSDYRF